jgi:hypothetical protein
MAQSHPSPIPELIHRLARAAGLVIGGGFALLVLLEYQSPDAVRAEGYSPAMASIYFVAIFLGLLLARRWDLLGAAIALVGLLGFSFYVAFADSPLLWILALAILLYLVDWLAHPADHWSLRPKPPHRYPLSNQPPKRY